MRTRDRPWFSDDVLSWGFLNYYFLLKTSLFVASVVINLKLQTASEMSKIRYGKLYVKTTTPGRFLMRVRETCLLSKYLVVYTV